MPLVGLKRVLDWKMPKFHVLRKLLTHSGLYSFANVVMFMGYAECALLHPEKPPFAASKEPFWFAEAALLCLDKLRFCKLYIAKS